MDTRDLSTKGKRLEYWILRKFRDPKQKNEEWGAKTRAAKALDMSPQQLGKYISDTLDPMEDVQLRFAAEGLNLHWYQTGQGEMEAPASADTLSIPGAIPASVLSQLPIFDLSTPEGAAAYVEWFEATMARVAEEAARKAIAEYRREEGDG